MSVQIGGPPAYVRKGPNQLVRDLDYISERVAYNPESGCVEWQRSVSIGGYGTFGSGGRGGSTVYAHRFVYEQTTGQVVPVEYDVCHHCDNPPCVRFDHLFVGTRKENMQDAQSKGRLAKPGAKLNVSSVYAIRLLKTSGWSHRNIAKMFGVSHATIGYIMRGEIWREVPA